MTDDQRITGVGLGLRHDFAAELLARCPSEVRWLEIHPENYVRRGGGFALNLERAAERWALVPHGLSLGFGNLAPFDPAYTRDLKELLDRIDAPWYSDHLCFAAVGETYLHDLLPLPFVDETIEVASARIRELADRLERPVAVENVSYYAPPGPPALSEPEFLAAVLEEADCPVLLDVNNVYVNAINHGFDPRRYIDRVPRERVVQIHVAGHHVRPDGLIIDTHGEPLIDGVYSLLEYAIERLGPVPVLLERDQNMPPLDELLDEVRRLAAIHDRASAVFAAREERAIEASAP